MNIALTSLWLPILLGGALCWMLGGLIHMAFKYHNKDYLRLKNEDDVRDVLANSGAELGLYSVPYCVDPKEAQNPDMQEKFKQGPVAFITFFENGLPNMGKLMGQQILFTLSSCVLIAYCATLALPAGAEYMQVFRFIAATAFLAFGWALVPQMIWYGMRPGTLLRYLLDAFLYAMLLAGVFAWLWPAA